MDVPEVAVRWLLRYAENNSEFATISNVCRNWRDSAVATVLEQAQDSLETSSVKHEGPTSLLLLPSMVRCLLRSSEDGTGLVDTFCIAWFDPSGMETRAVPLSANYSDDDDGDDDKLEHSEPFAPQGGASYAGSEEEDSRRRRGRSRSPTPLLAAASAGLRRVETTTKHARCLYQWNGYREAVDVLRPFGYAATFVKRVVEQSQSMTKAAESGASVEKKTDVGQAIGQVTYAVRGATFARPDGYCQCWDVDQAAIDSQVKNGDDSKSGIRQKERKELIRRRNRRRRDLHRLVLPRVVDYNYGRASTPSKAGKWRQQCVQFLNVDGSHAVRVFTPPFKHGPYSTPITIFCVAIATEDGCFLDGLQSRFEFGHLYPNTENDKLIERSPICVCTALQGEAMPRGAASADDGYINCDPSSSNSDDSSCYMSNDVIGAVDGFRCSCPFANIGKAADNDDDDQDPPQRLCRGRRGPGVWHCYVAVVDGKSSSIRIDGVPEALSCESNGIEGMTPSLDGLTIGSDRTFDMSLCFGLGSDGEGEGAMAELVVFKGMLDIGDVRVLEQRLMAKHGIDPPKLEGGDLAQEDQWNRYAHALLSHPPHHKLVSCGTPSIPLRYLARHRLVAWDQSNAVTGEAVKVQKIGSGKMGGYSSSDW